MVEKRRKKPEIDSEKFANGENEKPTGIYDDDARPLRLNASV
jgi:hypothetical protein